MAKVAIEWPDVVRIVSAQNFVVEDDVGGRFHGSLGEKAPRDQLSVQVSARRRLRDRVAAGYAHRAV